MTAASALGEALEKTGGTTEKMPVIFVGHGNPMNAIEDNEFSRAWTEAARRLPRPKAILCVSAHWETEGVRVTAMPKPRTIHDFLPLLYALALQGADEPLRFFAEKVTLGSISMRSLQIG